MSGRQQRLRGESYHGSRCGQQREVSSVRPDCPGSRSRCEEKRPRGPSASDNRVLTVRINPAHQAGHNATTRQRLAALGDPRNAERLRFCPHLYRTLLERRSSGGHRPIRANLVAFGHHESDRGGAQGRSATDSGRKPCALTVQEWEQLRTAYNRKMNAPPEKVERSNREESVLTSSLTSNERDTPPHVTPGENRRPPSKRERRKQSEYRLRRWKESADDHSSSEDETHLSSHSGSHRPRRRPSDSRKPQRRSEGQSRAMSNMTKILAAVNASSPTEHVSKLADKRSTLVRTTDSGIWCEGTPDAETLARPGRPCAQGQSLKRQDATVDLLSCESASLQCAVSDGERRNLEALGATHFPNSSSDRSTESSKTGSGLQTVCHTCESETTHYNSVPAKCLNLPTGCNDSQEEAFTEKRLPSLDCSLNFSTSTSCLNHSRREKPDPLGHLKTSKTNPSVASQDETSFCSLCENRFADLPTSGSPTPLPSQRSSQLPRPSILKRPRPEIAYVVADVGTPVHNGGAPTPDAWGYMCGCCEPPQRQAFLLGGRDSQQGAYTQLPVIYECVCAECTRRSADSAPRYYQLTPKAPQEPVKPAHQHVVGVRGSAHPKRRSRGSRRGRRNSDARSLTSTFSTTSRFAAVFLECFNCFDDDSESLSSGGSDSDNDDGDDGGDESEGYEEHGDGVSIDDDSDGGDSGSESGGDVSLNSAELFDDQNNMFDIKNAMGEGEESDGAPNTDGSDSDSLTELRSRSKKGSDDDDEDDSDDYDLDDGEFDDSLDSIAIYERE